MVNHELLARPLQYRLVASGSTHFMHNPPFCGHPLCSSNRGDVFYHGLCILAWGCYETRGIVLPLNAGSYAHGTGARRIQDGRALPDA